MCEGSRFKDTLLLIAMWMFASMGVYGLFVIARFISNHIQII
jgi:hypothetical protein